MFALDVLLSPPSSGVTFVPCRVVGVNEPVYLISSASLFFPVLNVIFTLVGLTWQR